MNLRLPITPVGIMNFFFTLGLTFILLVDDTLFESQDVRMYDFLLEVMPQLGHATVSFCVAVVLFSAFVLRNSYLEIVGLFLSGVFMMFMLTGSLLSFPNISSLAYGIWVLASFMTIVDVLHTIEDEKEENHEN